MKNKEEERNWGIFFVGICAFIVINFLTMAHFNNALYDETEATAFDYVSEFNLDDSGDYDDYEEITPNAGFSSFLADIDY
jgi:hypothetical protein